MGSQHCIAFQFGEAIDYTVFKFEDNSLDVAAEIAKNDVKPNNWNLVSSLKVSELGKPIVYILLPKAQPLTPFSSLGQGT